MGDVFEQAFERVHAANMKKFFDTAKEAVEAQGEYFIHDQIMVEPSQVAATGKWVIHDESGKLRKPRDFIPPSHKDLVNV